MEAEKQQQQNNPKAMDTDQTKNCRIEPSSAPWRRAAIVSERHRFDS
jgi:hypothetical protein